MRFPQPLHIPDSAARNPSLIERAAGWVPILGWIVASELEKHRLAAALDALDRQLKNRPATADNWPSERHRRLGLFMGGMVKDAFGWSSDNFIAEDPFGLMVLADDGAGTEVICSVEDHLRLPRGTISNEHFDAFLALTFGQVIDALIRISDGFSQEAR